MLKALVVKELRETVGIMALAVLGSVYVLTEVTGFPLLPWQGRDLYSLPFISGSFGFYFALLAGGLAVALGLKQTAWEDTSGTYHFLLHRPLNRRRVFGVKLAVGCLLLLGLTAVVILIYAAWAATPGSHSAPFFWSMTAHTWQAWFAMLLVYVGAFLSGIRPARWFGSRLVPLAAAVMIAVLASVIPWWWLGWPLTALGVLVGLTAVFYQINHRDY